MRGAKGNIAIPMDRKAGLSLAALALALPVLALVSFSLGRYPVPLADVGRILLGGALGRAGTDPMSLVVLRIRLPRILMAVIVGAALAAAGASFQGLFQNPLASPDILGASNGAAFGAGLSILLGATRRWTTAGAFLFGLLTIALVRFVARRAKGGRTVALVLAGIVVGSLFSAGLAWIKLVADPNNQLPQITYWLMGSLSGSTLDDVLLAFVPIALGLAPLLLLRWRINLLVLGDDEARSLGVDTGPLRSAVILCGTLATAAAVSFSGIIGWVGLVIPHLARRLVGSDHRRLLPASCLAGALFLLLVDDVSRTLLAVEIPIGILTAFIGAPFFIHLLCRKEKSL